jgi:hypothetical protein
MYSGRDPYVTGPLGLEVVGRVSNVPHGPSDLQSFRGFWDQLVYEGPLDVCRKKKLPRFSPSPIATLPLVEFCKNVKRFFQGFRRVLVAL